MSQRGTTDYHVVPRDSLDSDREDAHEHLLPSSASSDVNYTCGTRRNTYRIFTLYPYLLLRLVNGILGFVAFMLLVACHGGKRMIATDVFLMLTVVLNALVFLHHFFSTTKNILQVKVTFREREGSPDHDVLNRPRPSGYLDLLFSFCLLITLPITWVRKPDYDINKAQKAAVILGYIVIIFQILLALPNFDRISFSIDAHVEPLERADYGSFFGQRRDKESAGVDRAIHPESSAIPPREERVESSSALV